MPSPLVVPILLLVLHLAADVAAVSVAAFSSLSSSSSSTRRPTTTTKAIVESSYSSPSSSSSSSLRVSFSSQHPPPGGGEERNTIDQYSNSLSPRRRRLLDEKEAVMDESRRYAIIDDDARAVVRRGPLPRFLRSVASTSANLVGGVASTAYAATMIGSGVGDGNGGRSRVRPGSLILLRCGESEWTRSGRFTGWADPDLVPEGILEIEHAGR
jgi:hypothetical protein